MDSFIAYELAFDCEAVTPMALPRNKGSTLRGAFFGALRRDFCLNKSLISCRTCPTAAVCPICRLVATVEKGGSRGEEVPRPFALKPVISNGLRWEAGDTFSFGLTLFGSALSLFPYVVLAVRRMGETGMGDRAAAPGRFHIREARAVNPASGIEKTIHRQGESLVHVPDIPITHADVLARADSLPQDRVELEIITPMRLIISGSLVHRLSFRALVQRLLGRLTDLYRYCTDERLAMDFAGLLQKAEEVRVVEDGTRWLDLSSYSRRRDARTPIGGLVGSIAFEGPLRDYLPLLVWGQFTQVGKDVTKGNGWYRIAFSCGIPEHEPQVLREGEAPDGPG